ncbi:MAG: aromatic ring-hydroxylating dioxygenase subunit alpha [Rhodobacteraceae bacterium]|nr:aromatic ring-hydroxylating dioxygenase subunit alpha [Paracoccaceae bacterium]
MNGTVERESNKDRMRRILGKDGYARLFRSIDDAAGLPNEAYWNQEWFRMEQELVFRRSWVFAGARGELPEPGCMKPIDVAGTPVILVHGRDGVIRGFQNVCRHRGMQLVAEPCKKATLTCPYHKWAYGIDGKLRTRPHFDGPNQTGTFRDGGGERLDLIPVRVEEFFGCLFANVSGTAEPLADWMAPVLDQLEGYDLSSIRWAGKRDFEVKANWKLVYENYMEGYHVFSLHPRLLRFAPMDVRWSGEWRGSTFVNNYHFPKLEEGRGEGLPHFPDLSEENRMKGQWFLTMPHFAVEVYPDQFTVLVAYPEAPDRCREELHVFVVGEEAATGEKYAGPREDLINMWDDLNREDISVLAGLQQGRRCFGYDGGRLSPHWEGPTLAYAHKIIGLMADSEDYAP